MIFKMDTDAVRALATRFRTAADVIELGATTTNRNVQNAPWQSQAREEFILEMEMLNNSILRSAEVLRMMGMAAEQKASQWEAVGNMFNGPWQAMGNAWGKLKSMMGWLWSRIKGGISGIKWPSVPSEIFPGFIGGGVIGGIGIITPRWPFKPPSGWPPYKQLPDPIPTPRPPYGPLPRPLQPLDPDKLPDRTIPSKGILRPYPQPPNSPTLRKVTGNPSSYTCATYARDRRPDLGPTGPATEDYPLGAAANYRHKFSDTAFQINQSDGSLTDAIGPGYAIVWEPDHDYADNTYGHVAIVEAVYPDHIVISEAVRDANGVYYIREKTISLEELNNDSVWLIP